MKVGPRCRMRPGGGGSEPRDSISNGCWKDDGPFVRFKLAKVKAIGIFLTYKQVFDTFTNALLWKPPILYTCCYTHYCERYSIWQNYIYRTLGLAIGMWGTYDPVVLGMRYQWWHCRSRLRRVLPPAWLVSSPQAVLMSPLAAITIRYAVKPYNTQIFLYKPWRAKEFFNLKPS